MNGRDETIEPQRQPSLLLTLGLISAVIVPQIGIGLSAPALAELAGDFHAPVEMAQNTLILYMTGYALSVLASGLLADRFGPHRVQLWGLALAAAACMLCAAAGQMTPFFLARFVQAVGGCVGTVTARLIVGRDYPAGDRMKILTTLSCFVAVTPCLAPLAGGALLPYTGWRGLFAVNALICAAAFALFLAATRGARPHPQAAAPLKAVGAIYLRNLKMPRFVLYAAAISIVWMSYFAFVSCSSGPLRLGMSLSAFAYGLVLALATAGEVAGSLTARFVSGRGGIDRVARMASRIALAGGICLVVCARLFPGSILAMLLPTMAILFATGMTIPAAQAGLLEHVRRDAGISAGLFFFLQMIAGAVYAALGNTWPGMTPPILAVLVAAPAIAMPFLLGWLMRRAVRYEITRDEIARHETP